MGFIAHLYNEGIHHRNFLISKLLTGAQNLRSVSDVRLPITLPILAQLIRAVPLVFTSHYKCLMPCAMIVLVFKAYLRVGEMVPWTNGISQNYLQFNDVSIHDTIITVSFRHFKHSGSHYRLMVQGHQTLPFPRLRGLMNFYKLWYGNGAAHTICIYRWLSNVAKKIWFFAQVFTSVLWS